MASNDIKLRIPSKYNPALQSTTETSPSPSPSLSSPAAGSDTDGTSGFINPPLDWLARTWAVTHSTLAMWRTARNVRITYKPLPPSPPSADGPRPRVDDLVEYEKSSGKGGLKTVSGVDTACGQSDTGSWDWRGNGLLGFVTSHWEILGWGEREIEGGGGDVESWVVTWFAPTLFTKEGLDLYSSRREGMSPKLAEDIITQLKEVNSPDVVEMVKQDMTAVEIELPWKEK